MLQTEDQCTKYSEPVMDVLHSKHPDARPPTRTSLESYPVQLPDLILIDMTEDTVTDITGNLSIGSGTRGSDLVSLNKWLLQFRAASGEV